MNTREGGALGEVSVARYLREKGYDIVTANYQCRLGEIDIIAENKKYLCFVEVKTRGERSFFAPADAVDYNKRKKLIATAKFYLSIHPTNKQPRFDIAEVYTKQGKVQKIHLIKNAFDAEGQ